MLVPRKGTGGVSEFVPSVAVRSLDTGFVARHFRFVSRRNTRRAHSVRARRRKRDASRVFPEALRAELLDLASLDFLLVRRTHRSTSQKGSFANLRERHHGALVSSDTFEQIVGHSISLYE